MPTALTGTCPNCQATVTDDAATCASCGAEVSVFRAASRTPLILPGNPALSDDLVRKTISPLRILAGTAVGAAALFGILWGTRDENGTPTGMPSAASASTVPTASVADTQPSVTVARVDTLPPIPSVVPAADSTPAAPAPAVAVAPSPVPVSPPPVVTRPTPAPASIPATNAASIPASRAIAAATPPATVAAPIGKPMLKLTPLVSDTLKPGELLQLRWSVFDRATGKAMAAPVEFTSTDASVATVDRRSGIVTARAPGRVGIIVDGGVAGQNTMAIVVRPAPTAVAAAPAEPLQGRTEAARSSSILAPVTTTAAPAPAVSAPVPTPAPVRRVELPGPADVRTVVDRFVSAVRRDGGEQVTLMQFMADGAGHRVALVGAPVTIGSGSNNVRVTFELRLSKFDGGGRPVTRIAPITMDIEKHDMNVSPSSVDVGTLRKP